ncbi:beta-lactamase family protein [Cordyceps fumosorosea ARSEF 2679]|uniref:Beta-lactamase family protein n=1 Tax=Cordyceps fumosorosea (strain ARSEF 2679) TaxID=1081104 RepID=A0A167SBY8_CORFA|nr:beta-lactamase family protein [Cordyceps fumosorosea ARSEF 2679]OAA59468.1 beta-lactamase family protein [Cordyceps fumosorosea ARSEF 2679]
MDYFLSDAFGARAEALLAKYRVPGLAVAITLHGRIEARAFGLARLPDAESPEPVPCTPDTLFDIASASKSMTAAAVALLVDDDEKHRDVRYDAAVSALLPGDFVMPTEELTRGVTLDDMLSHRTGMPTHDWSYLGIGSKTPDTARSVTRNLRNLPVCAPLRTKYMYNNMMYTVATHLVEQRTGLSFSDFLETTFFAPLGMSSTSLQPSRARAKGFGPRMASGYTWVRAPTGRHMPVPMVQCPEANGAGSIITSVRDYVRWVDAMLRRPAAAPLTEASVRDGLLRPRAIVDPDGPPTLPHSSPALYCAGLESDWYRGHQRLDHGGGVTGFATKQTFLPASGFGCVVAANSSEGGHAAGTVVVRELIDEVLGVPEAERPDWEALVDGWEAENEDEDDPDKCEAALTAEILESLSKDEDGKDAKADDGVENGDGEKEAAVPAPQPLTTSLETYAGTYEHPGYHQLVLEIKDGDKLFVDASERSFGFTGIFNHVADQRLFTLRIAESEAWGGQDLTAVKAEFRLDVEGGKVSQLGIAMEPDMKDTDEEMIWFTRK